VGWEPRAGILYYYRRVRIGGRQVRLYFGRGELAETAAQLDVLERTRRQLERAQPLQLRKMTCEAEDTLERFEHLTDLLARAAIQAAGYYLHHRSEWRRTRRQHTVTINQPPKSLTPEQIQ
jgi:hypothetical protein